MDEEGLNKKLDDLTSTVNRLSYQFDNYVSHRAAVTESGEIDSPGAYAHENKTYGEQNGMAMEQFETDYTQDFSKDENEDRGNWSGRLDFILSCLGFAVGLGNVWRFPYLCYVNGGAVFFIPYCIMLFFVGMPIFAMEVSLGQYTSKGPVAAWQCCRLFSGIGIGMACVSIFIGIYYVMIIGWSLFYLFASFTSKLPWEHCDREWSTEWCSEYLAQNMSITDCNQLGMNLSTNGVCYNGTAPYFIYNKTVAKEHGIAQITPSESYLYGYVWGRKPEHGIENMGGLRWQLVLVLLLAWVIVTLCLIRGIKSSGKVVYVTALFPYVVLLILLIRGVTLDGHYKGIEFYILKPDLDKLSEAKVWKDAAVQIFFSLSASYGGLISLSSYNRFHNDCIRDTLIVSLGNCLTSFFAGFVIFSFLGFLAEKHGVEVPDVAASGIGLAFTVYTDAVTRMPLSPLWAILFFLMLITLGLDSEFVFVETLMTIISDHFVSLRKKKHLMCIGIAIGFFLLGLTLCTPAGSIMITLIDTYAGGWNLLLIALFECIAIGYVYGAYRFRDDISTMIGTYSCGCFPWSACSVWWIMCWCLFTPAGVIFILVFSWVDFSPAADGDYTFPEWGDALGWLMTVTCVIGMIIPGVAWMCVETGSFTERLHKLLTPSKYWGPDLVKHRRLVRHLDNFVVDPYGNKETEKTDAYDNNYDANYNSSITETELQAEDNYGYE